eukprot:Ihof_evm4s668 gene=Ihof_evmTU4s668
MSQDKKGTKVYVGNLDDDITDHDLRDTFDKYGNLTDAWVARKPPGFGFVWYRDQRDAEDAVHALDGKDLRGRSMRVELSHVRAVKKDIRDSECFQCGERGHFARDCPRGRGGNGRGRSGGRRGYDSRSRSRSRSPPRRYRSRSRSRERSRSRSPPRRYRSRSPRDNKRPVRSPSRSISPRGRRSLSPQNIKSERPMSPPKESSSSAVPERRHTVSLSPP